MSKRGQRRAGGRRERAWLAAYHELPPLGLCGLDHAVLHALIVAARDQRRPNLLVYYSARRWIADVGVELSFDDLDAATERLRELDVIRLHLAGRPRTDDEPGYASTWKVRPATIRRLARELATPAPRRRIPPPPPRRVA